MVARVRFCEVCEPAARVVEVAAVDDHAADAGSVAADELCGAVGDYVRAPFHGAEQVGRGKGIVQHQHHVVLLGDRGDLLDWKDADVRVSKRFPIDDLGVRLERLFKI